MSSPSPQALKPSDLFEALLYENAAGEKLPYRLLPPLEVEPVRKYPLVLCLHGVGERGDDNVRQLIHAAPRFAEPEIRETFPAWVIVPQCPANQRWAEVDWRSEGKVCRPEQISPALRLCLEAISSLEKEGAVDPLRIYVVGLSMGGFGTWDLVSRTPDIFAAAVPICGGGDETQASYLSKMPIWAFHGGKDEVVPPEYSRRMIRAIEASGGHPRYTEYPEVGHNSWEPAMREPELFPWLFSQALSR